MMTQEKLSILTEAAKHREAEVLHHQINIDNYRLAIKEIAENYSNEEYLVEFANYLSSLLESSIQEQTKEKILLKVIKDQIGSCHDTR